jgi:hypothetical protein
LSCFGFLFFLSFFCELLPLPMVALRWGFYPRQAACEPFLPFNRHIRRPRSVQRREFSWPGCGHGQPGKLEAVHAWFRAHQDDVLAKHGATSVASQFLVATDYSPLQ